SYQDMADNLIPKQESEFAKDYLHRLQARDFEHIKKYIDPSIEAQVTDEKLLEVAEYFPSGELLSTELIGSQVNVFNGKWQGNFSFEYHFADGWALANVVLKKSDENLSVIGFNVYRTKASQKELNKFTLGGKTPLHYFVLVSAVLAPLFILVTTYFCIRTPIPKRKWLWVIFVLVGIGSISINWSTGQFGIQPLSIKLFSASAVAAGPFAPWIISASVPLGAIMFWFRRKGFIAASGANNQVNKDASR
ncbi:MAG: hypothetical protein K9K86_06280, partial [Pseudomonadales bacterium]|nr:hypothetical protein [Pseudomonadales bacterium]